MSEMHQPTAEFPLDPYVDPIPHNPGDQVPVPQAESEAPESTQDQLPSQA